MSGVRALWRREFSLNWRGGGGPLLAIAFYLALATLLPMATGASPEQLALIAPGSAWLALALASLLSLERLFERDYEDAALDLIALGPAPLELTALIKCLSQWVVIGAPLALLTPIVAAGLGAEPSVALIAMLVALAGGLGFTFCGGIGAALALGARSGGLLIAVVVLPLFVPPVIFGAGAIAAFRDGLSWGPDFMLLSAYDLALVALGPFAMAAACRNALS